MGVFSGFFSSGSIVSHILGEISSSKGGGGSSSGYSRSIIGNESCVPEIDIKVYPKDSDTILGKLVETIDELEQTKEDAKAEALEIMTDGVWEMGIKKNSDYKTSFEIKEEAEKKIEDARYAAQKKQIELQTLAKRVDAKIKELYKKKLKMADLINQHIGTEPSEPFMEAENYSGITGQRGAQSCVARSDGKSLTNFLMQKERKEQAKQYLEAACDYEIEMYQRISEMNTAQLLLESIMNYLEEEDGTLDNLANYVGKNGVITNEIVTYVNVLLNEAVIDASGKENMNYIQAIFSLHDNCK